MEVALTYPTVVYTVVAAVSLGFMLLSLVSGLGDGDAGADADGLLGPVLGGLQLTGVPPTFIVALTATFGGFASLVISDLVDLSSRSTATVALGGTAIGLVALVPGLLATAVAARPLAWLFQWAPATQQADLVGRVCTVRTATVTDRHGQAEVDLPGLGTLLVQVRAAEPNDFTTHTPALLIDHDPETGVFQIAGAAELTQLDDLPT